MSSRDETGARAGSAILLAILLAAVVAVPTASSAVPAPRPAAAATANVTVAMTRLTTFTPTQIVAEPGQNVSLTIVNAGIMVHSFTLYSEANVTAPLSAFRDMLDFNDTHAKIVDAWIPAGETWVVNFTAPSTPGRYLYVCMVNGHWTTMNGLLVVGGTGPAAGGWPLGLVPTIMVGTIALVLVLAAGYQVRAMRAVRRPK